MGTTRPSDLIAEARDYANRRTGTVPGDLVLRLVIDLEAVTAERDSAKRGAKTLGEIVVRHVEDMLRWAGMEDQIGVDDPDQQLAWELCAEMPGKITRLQAVIADIREARSNHPECDVHDDADPVTCGWKRTVQDIDAALSRIPEHPKED